MPKYYPINEEAARRAKNANSFPTMFPAPLPPLTMNGGSGLCLGEQQKGRVDPMYHEKIDAHRSLCPQAGGEHQSEQSHRRPCTLHPHRPEAPTSRCGKRKSRTPPGIRTWANICRSRACWIRCAQQVWAGSAQTMTGLWKSWRQSWQAGAMQEEMKTVNAYYRKHKTLDAVPSCPPRKSESSSPLWHPTGAKIPYPIRPICLPTTTPTSAAHASALRI